MGFSFNFLWFRQSLRPLSVDFEVRPSRQYDPSKKFEGPRERGGQTRATKMLIFLETHAGWYDIEYLWVKGSPPVGWDIINPKGKTALQRYPKRQKSLLLKGLNLKGHRAQWKLRQLANRGMSFLTLWHPKNGFWGSILGPILMRESLPSPFFWTTPIANHNRFLYRQLQGLFDSLFRVLFTFPLRYLWAIGLPPRYLALDGMYHPFSGSTLKLPYS